MDKVVLLTTVWLCTVPTYKTVLTLNNKTNEN